MLYSLAFVKRHFPQVEKVVDALQPIRLNVMPEDVVAGREKDPRQCAFAKACVRQLRADGAIINISTSYVVKGKIATRYLTSGTVGREITSFDRHHDFMQGTNYLLAAIPTSRRFGRKDSLGRKSGKHGGGKAPPRAVHRTENIRISLT